VSGFFVKLPGRAAQARGRSIVRVLSEVVVEVRIIFSVGWVFLALNLCVAQAKNPSKAKTRPDLSGVWALDNSKSKPIEKVSNYVLTIVHQEPQIRMTRKYTQGGREHTVEVTYYTDGRPESNPQRRVGDPEPIIRWQGSKLVRRAISTPAGMTGHAFPPLEIVTREEWELSPDRTTLTRTITNSGIVTSKFKYVFNRIS